MIQYHCMGPATAAVKEPAASSSVPSPGGSGGGEGPAEEAAASLFSHPWQSPLPEPADGGAPLAWTPDIDDMLLLISRQHAFVGWDHTGQLLITDSSAHGTTINRTTPVAKDGVAQLHTHRERWALPCCHGLHTPPRPSEGATRGRQ